ncbi:MAG: DNA-binding protein [Dehalococcoidales bacterium]|nr:MAG: DNA-binding protein [Dehalococcoidales bacterium]
MFKKVHVFRVKPGQELASEIDRYCNENGVSSAVFLGIIGSVTGARLNFLKELPGKYETREYKGPLEIVGAQGSVAYMDSQIIVHLHLQVSNQHECYGGHLVEAEVFSTAEVMIGELTYQVYRYADDYTGLNELQF